MWRLARSSEDSDIIAMCVALYREDPSPRPVPASQTETTLKEFRKNPLRGRAVVLELNEKILGYALLASFWSNEVGGEICYIDELYVQPECRGQGHGRGLVEMVLQKAALWPGPLVGVELEVTPTNHKARELYSRLGFKPVKNQHMRVVF